MKWFVISLLWILALFPNARASTLPSKITVGTNDMPPWVDQGAPQSGIIAKIVERAFSLAQMQSELFWIPWKRLFQPSLDYTLHAVFPMGFSEERAKIFHFSDELITLDRVACHLKEQAFRWSTPEDFRGKKISFRRGAYFGPLYQKLRDQNIATFIEADSDLSMIRMLLSKRIDMFFCQPREMKASLVRAIQDEKLTADQAALISMKGKPILSAPLFVGFPRYSSQGRDNIISPQLRKRFNRGLALLRRQNPELFHSVQH